MKKTDNIYLIKPEYHDRVEVSHINENSDKTDWEINELKSEITTKAPIESPIFTGTPKIKLKENPEIIEDIITTSYVDNALEVENLDV